MAARKKKASSDIAGLAFATHLEKSGLQPVYLLLGEERYVSAEVARLIRREAFDGEEDSPSLSRFDARSAAVGEFLDEARTLPFFGGGRRVVMVENAEALMESPPDSWTKRRREEREAEIDGFFRYLQSPVDSATLVLIAKKVDRRTKLTKTLLDRVKVVGCDTPGEPELLRWLKRRVTAPGFAPGALELLLSRSAGGSVGVGRLAAEVDKLAASAGDKGPITREMVGELVQASSADGLFDLLKVINSGRLDRALDMLGAMLRDGAVDRGGKRVRDTSGVTAMAVGTLAWDLRMLWRAWSLVREGRTEAAIKKELKTWSARDYVRRAKALQRTDLEAMHRALRKADMGMKSNTPPVANLTQLVITLTGLAKR